MIDILNMGPSVLACRIDGAIDEGDIERAFAEVDAKLLAGGGLRAYVELRSITGISLMALWKDVWLGIQRLNLLPRLDKVALVTDLEWLRRTATMPGRLFPGVDVRAYPLKEQPEAMAWVRL